MYSSLLTVAVRGCAGFLFWPHDSFPCSTKATVHNCLVKEMAPHYISLEQEAKGHLLQHISDAIGCGGAVTLAVGLPAYSCQQLSPTFAARLLNVHEL